MSMMTSQEKKEILARKRNVMIAKCEQKSAAMRKGVLLVFHKVLLLVLTTPQQ
jgi:hypothetical protein